MKNTGKPSDEQFDDDANLDDEDVDNDVEDDEDVEDDTDDEGENDDDTEDDDDASDEDDDDTDDDTDTKTPPDVKKTPKKTPDRKFNDEQQKELDRIIKTRLERQESKLIREYSDIAGVDLDAREVEDASKLWGLLKTNSQLSGEVDALINQYLASGKAKEPEKSRDSNTSQRARLELKEAILDLKSDDSVFNKYSKQVLDWAENEDYEVKDAKSLKLAYLAWKAERSALLTTSNKTKDKQKQKQKDVQKKRASVQSSKGGKATTDKNYGKMSDTAVLKAEGLSLFTED